MWSVVNISIKIDLLFETFCDKDFDKVVKGRNKVIRIMSHIQFGDKNGSFTKPYRAIVDTGAFVSIIPRHIWSQCDTKILGEYYMVGLVPKEECTLPVLVGEISGRFIDKEKAGKAHVFMSYLALTNEVPLIVGFRDLLDICQLYASYPQGIAFIEE